ncbi:hypothetical protein OG21DRAFT_132242 [Imleria badia]|nr:hypothetical protein OG21DRAFT_132242 [Imleria badia]
MKMGSKVRSPRGAGRLASEGIFTPLCALRSRNCFQAKGNVARPTFVRRNDIIAFILPLCSGAPASGRWWSRVPSILPLCRTSQCIDGLFTASRLMANIIRLINRNANFAFLILRYTTDASSLHRHSTIINHMPRGRSIDRFGFNFAFTAH